MSSNVIGIVELEALRAIEQELGGKIPARSLFDFIAGTSTGGIIALGVGVKCWSVAECTHYFESLCKKAFTARKGADLFGIGMCLIIVNSLLPNLRNITRCLHHHRY